MGSKAKIAIVVLLTVIVILAVWQFTSPHQLPPVGTKYMQQSIYVNRGAWTILENMSNGHAYFGFSIANESYPRAGMQTFYTLTISNINQTISGGYVNGFGLRVESMQMQDSIDGSVSSWGIGSNVTDAVQVNGLFNFRTSATHHVRFTVTYQLYDLLPIGSLPDKTLNNSFNITQAVL